MIDFSQARVTVVGDAIQDHWVYGHSDRLSPEGPWPVHVYEREVICDGGAANVAANIKALGGNVALISPYRRSQKYRFMAGRHQMFRHDVETTAPIWTAEEDRIFAAMEKSDPQVVVLSDYGKGCFGGNLAERIITWCGRAGIPTVIDPSGDWHRYCGATVVTPNATEAPPDPKIALALHGIRAILRTEGERGMTLFDMAEKPQHIPASGPNVVDIVGAGDTVVAALALGMAIELPLIEAAKIANAAAGVVVGKPGTATCSREELEAAL